MPLGVRELESTLARIVLANGPNGARKAWLSTEVPVGTGAALRLGP